MTKNYCVFKTLQNYYVYDAGCNRFTQISEELYHRIQENNSIETSNEFLTLKQLGFFLNEIKLQEHPVTKVLPDLINRQMQVMVLQVTQGCNLRCHYCPYSQSNNITRGHSGKMMTWDTAKKAIDFICTHSVDSQFVTLDFYGGEPLLNFSLIKKSVDYIKNALYGKDLNFGITTNATLLSEEIIEFLDSNNFTLVISLDGDKKSNDKNRSFATDSSKSVFDTVMKKIYLIYTKYNNLFQKLTLNMVLDPAINYSEYENLLIKHPFLEKIKIDVVVKDDSYSDVKNVWSDKFTEKYDYKIFLGYLRSLMGFGFKSDLQYFSGVAQVFDRDVYTSQITSNGLYSSGNVTPSGMCMVGHDKIFVTVDGNLLPCERVNETDENIIFGNITEGIDYEKMKQILNYHNLFSERCKSCIAVRECGMCLNNFGTTGLIDNELTSKVCKQNRTEFIQKLIKRATINEAKQIMLQLKNGGYGDEK